MTYNYDDLGQYDADFENAESPSFGDVPPGTYQAWVERAWIEKRDGAFHPDFKLQCRVVGGEFAGKCLFPSQSFGPDYIKYLKGCLASMDLEPPIKRASEIRHRLDDMLDRVLEIKVVHKKGDDRTFINYYVQRFIGWKDGGGAPASAPAPSGAPNDEIPF
jgi:hypothetical protein